MDKDNSQSEELSEGSNSELTEYFSNSSILENNPTAVISKENAKEETKDIDIMIDSKTNVEDAGYIQDLKSECKIFSIYELKYLLRKELSYTDEHNNLMQDLSNSFSKMMMRKQGGGTSKINILYYQK